MKRNRPTASARRDGFISLAIGLGALGCVCVGLLLTIPGTLRLMAGRTGAATAAPIIQQPDLAPHQVTIAHEPFAGSGPRHIRSVWLLIAAERGLARSDALEIGQYYDGLHADARFFYAIFVCDPAYANEVVLTTLKDDEYNPYVMFEYLHWPEDPGHAEPEFLTADEITYGGTQCSP